METLDLSGNHLSGTIPSCVSNFRKIEKFILRENEFSGELPRGFLNIPTLQYADFGGNMLTGSLDALFKSRSSRSSANTLNIFSVSDNMLTGEIPAEFSNFSAILRFTYNELTGSLNNSFCDNNIVEVDCREVNCTCCASCLTDSERKGSDEFSNDEKPK